MECTSELDAADIGPTEDRSVVLGLPFLHYYYSVWDRDNKRIGLAKAKKYKGMGKHNDIDNFDKADEFYKFD